MSNILIVPVAFSADEAEFLSTALTRVSESALPGSAERFWLEKLQRRVQEALVDVVAGDSAARLAASSMPMGMPPIPPVGVARGGSGGSPGITTVVIGAGGGGGGGASVNNGVCTCGYPVGSNGCQRKHTGGTHP